MVSVVFILPRQIGVTQISAEIKPIDRVISCHFSENLPGTFQTMYYRVKNRQRVGCEQIKSFLQDESGFFEKKQSDKKNTSTS